MNKTSIPVQNIYFMLYYAWNKLDEAEIVNVKNIDENELIELFARVLIGGLTHLLKRGFDRSYVEITEDTETISGKIDFSASIKRNLLSTTRLVCTRDKFSHNVLHNQIIKTTIGNLLKIKELEEKLRDELVGLYRYFSEIDSIEIRENTFSRVKLNRNNFFYDFLIKICYLLYRNILIDERTGESKFKNFLQDEKQMAYLFEEFIRNFYIKEQHEFQDVGREYIAWDAVPEQGSLEYLPQMETDISLTSKERKIIIDTKFYKETLKQHYNKEKIISNNLYQLFAYLKNVEKKDYESRNCEGILLYPTVKKEVDLSYEIQGHKVSVKTINLNHDHRQIHRDLLHILH